MDTGSVGEAVRSVRAIYHICPNLHPEEQRIGEALIAAAESAGVERFVFHSVLHPAVERMPHHWRKMRVEERLFESPLAWTVLQPTAYLQNLRASWGEILAGEFRMPYPLGTRLSLVDLRDVAMVASAVLLEDGHAGAIYELVGAEAMTQEEVARRLGIVLGRTVRASEIPLEEWADSARRAGLGESQVEDLLQMFRYYAEFGLCGNPRTLRTLLGREPRSLEDFATRLRDDAVR